MRDGDDRSLLVRSIARKNRGKAEAGVQGLDSTVTMLRHRSDQPRISTEPSLESRLVRNVAVGSGVLCARSRLCMQGISRAIRCLRCSAATKRKRFSCSHTVTGNEQVLRAFSVGLGEVSGPKMGQDGQERRSPTDTAKRHKRWACDAEKQDFSSVHWEGAGQGLYDVPIKSPLVLHIANINGHVRIPAT